MRPDRTEIGRGAKGAWTAALLCIVVSFACGDDEERPSAGEMADSAAAGPSESSDTATTAAGALPGDTTSSAATLPDSTEWTIGVLTGPPILDVAPPAVPVLTALRTGVHADYERVTVELAGTSGLPGYRIEYVDRPLHDCGSGEPTYPVGDAWLEIRLEPAAAHTEEGRPTLGARNLAVDQPFLQRIYRTCDFEAIVTHVLALSEPNPFRVVRLANPPRIVVDVQR